MYAANNHVVAAMDKEGNAIVSSLDLDGKPRNVVDLNGSTQIFVYYSPEKNGRLKQSDKIAREYGSAGKAFNTAADWFQGLTAADSIINSGMDISGSLNLNNYFSNMQGTGGGGGQTLFGISPRN